MTTTLSILKSSLTSLSLEASPINNRTDAEELSLVASSIDSSTDDEDADAEEKDLRKVTIHVGPSRRTSRRGDALVTEWSQVRVTNWSETVEARVDRFRYPRDVDEVIELVRSNEKVRCSGAMHSCAPLISSEGIILSLTKLDQIISVDPSTRIVRTQAGVRMHDLCDYLAEYGLAVGTLGSIDWQTICGAVMTGTHGCGLTVPSLQAFVRSYTIVLPDGNLRKVERESSPTLFRAMAPSMGLFGAVVEMEMEAVPLQILEARIISVPMDEVIDRFDRAMRTNKYARIIVYPSINKATIWTANPVPSREAAVANGAEDNRGYTDYRNREEKALIEEHLDLCERGEFERADEVLELVFESQVRRLRHYVGRHNHVLCMERNNGIPHADIEMNFAYDQHRDVLRTMLDYCRGRRIPWDNFELRTTARDDALLSCCHSGPRMWMDFQAKANVSRPFFSDMCDLLRPHGFRRHWAKGMDVTDPRLVASEFPDVGRFLEAVRGVDPGGKFLNEQGRLWVESLEVLTEGKARPRQGGGVGRASKLVDDGEEKKEED